MAVYSLGRMSGLLVALLPIVIVVGTGIVEVDVTLFHVLLALGLGGCGGPAEPNRVPANAPPPWVSDSTVDAERVLDAVREGLYELEPEFSLCGLANHSEESGSNVVLDFVVEFDGTVSDAKVSTEDGELLVGRTTCVSEALSAYNFGDVGMSVPVRKSLHSYE